MMRIALLCLALVSTALAAADAPPRRVQDILDQVAQPRAMTPRLAELRATLAQEPAPDLDKKGRARHQLARADAADELGDLARTIELLTDVVALGGAEDPLWEMDRLSIAHLLGGDFARAIEINGRALEGTGNFAARTLARHGLRAHMLGLQGNLGEAQASLAKAEAALDSVRALPVWSTWSSIWIVNTAMPRSVLLMLRGRLAEAEAEARRALEAAEEDIKVNPLRLARRFATPSQRFVESRRDQALDQLARVLVLQGRGTEAEVAVRQGLANTLAREGGYSANAGQRLMFLALVLLYDGRFAEAQAIATATLEVLRRSGVPDTSIFAFNARRLGAAALSAQGRHTDAATEYRRVAEVFRGVPDMETYLAAGDVGWALSLVLSGDAEGAAAMAARLLPAYRASLGDGHVDTITLSGVRAMALDRLGRVDEAWRAYAAAVPALVRDGSGAGPDAPALQLRRVKLVLEAYLEFLAAQRGSAVERGAGIDFVAEAFRIADVLRSQGTQFAVTAAAARSAAGDAALGGDVRREQDLEHELSSLYRILRSLAEAPAAQRLPKVITDMQSRIAEIKAEQASLRATLAQRFPSYANLTRPQPPTLEQARAALRPGEALVAFASTGRATYAWAMMREGPVAFASAPLGDAALATRVAHLRRALDPGDELLSRLPAFDLEAAHRLYADLLAPVEAGWRDATSLLVATAGPLSQIPLAILPTAPPERAASLAAAPWLARKAAVSQLPSVNTLLTLRALRPAGAGRQAFVGFGDPAFATSTPAAATAPLRALVPVKAAQSEPQWMDYARLPPLPDTRDEILAVAKVLGADPSRDVFLGADASLANVRRFDLSSRRIVAFATHGLLPGEFPGVSEPSLALANPGGGRHGLLTLEDILKLKLDADWVVLSACNTAAGDGAGADAVSGLGRGFFYAGARSLLVTHWPVETVSARLLVTGAFERYARDAAVSRAEALRQAQLALMQGDARYAHPLFWAPYVVVGDGSAR